MSQRPERDAALPPTPRLARADREPVCVRPAGAGTAGTTRRPAATQLVQAVGERRRAAPAGAMSMLRPLHGRPVEGLGPPDPETLASGTSPRVLIVDDNAANLAAFEAILWDGNFDLVTAQSGAEAMRQLLLGDFAAILLDIHMPSLDGIETAKLIRARERSRDVPIIFITAHQPDQAQMLKGYASGAVDYLVKPVLPEILRFKVRVFVELFRKTKQIEWQAAQLRAVNARLQDEIAQRKEAERDAAFEREERQRVALASIADAVIATDAQGAVMSLNPMAEQLCGCTSESARGRRLSEILDTRSVEAQDPPEEALRRCIARDETIRARQPVELMHGR